MSKVNEDPEYKRLLNKIEKTFFSYRRALSELRIYFLNTELDKIDKLKSAVLQNNAHEAENSYNESLSNFSKFSWELVPHNSNKEHLELIRSLKEATEKRISKEPKGPKLRLYSIRTEISSAIYGENI